MVVTPVTGSLFMPLPLAMMIPFMGAQSAVMAKQFGENFQYGKRRISAMSNEEFNALTPQKLSERTRQELKDMIPSMQDSITDMRIFQEFIIKELIDTMKDALKVGLGEIFGISPAAEEKILKNISLLDPSQQESTIGRSDPRRQRRPEETQITEPFQTVGNTIVAINKKKIDNAKIICDQHRKTAQAKFNTNQRLQEQIQFYVIAIRKLKTARLQAAPKIILAKKTKELVENTKLLTSFMQRYPDCFRGWRPILR